MGGYLPCLRIVVERWEDCVGGRLECKSEKVILGKKYLNYFLSDVMPAALGALGEESPKLTPDSGARDLS